MKRLANKVALVTGAGQGVGQGIALALSDDGAAVAVFGRTLSKVEETCRLIRERGGRALAVECDVKDLASLKQGVDAVVKEFGGLQILVNCPSSGDLRQAGAFGSGRFSSSMRVERCKCP